MGLKLLVKIASATFKDSIFCLILLFLCFNPYAEISDRWRMSIIFTSFVLYLMVPRIIRCYIDKTAFDEIDVMKTLEQKEALVATLFHDLKSPVFSQISSLQMLEGGEFGELNKCQKDIVSAILHSCIYMKEMILTILATYKYNSGTIKFNYSNFDVMELVSGCINEIHGLAMERGIKFSINAGEISSNEIYADYVQIKRVIMNLLSNAISYAYKNSTVKISLANDKGYFRCYVENAGPNIPDETLKLLFQKYSSHSLKSIKAGIGLGLYLSKRIVKAHGGYIKAESEEERNVFSFYIPSVKLDDIEDKNIGKVSF